MTHPSNIKILLQIQGANPGSKTSAKLLILPCSNEGLSYSMTFL